MDEFITKIISLSSPCLVSSSGYVFVGRVSMYRMNRSFHIHEIKIHAKSRSTS